MCTYTALRGLAWRTGPRPRIVGRRIRCDRLGETTTDVRVGRHRTAPVIMLLSPCRSGKAYVRSSQVSSGLCLKLLWSWHGCVQLHQPAVQRRSWMAYDMTSFRSIFSVLLSRGLLFVLPIYGLCWAPLTTSDSYLCLSSSVFWVTSWAQYLARGRCPNGHRLCNRIQLML